MIFLSHGVLLGRDLDRISHALMLDEDAYRIHLQRMKYVPLADALAGKGDALTFDDASHAAIRGALIAREHGHPVTLFVNGWHVEARAPYFPYQLSAILDYTRKDRCFLLGRNWNLTTLAEKRTLRQELKRVYMKVENWDQIVALVRTVSEELGVPKMEDGLRTVERKDLLDAAAIGVDLQNHGWTHLNPQLYSLSQLDHDIQRNRHWLHQLTGREASVYAPPFGKVGYRDTGFGENVLIARGDGEGISLANRVSLSIHSATVESAMGDATDGNSSPQVTL